MSNVKYVFFGTPQLAADIAEHLKRHGLVPSLIVTNPDRPHGRTMRFAPPPVKTWALANDIPVLQPEDAGAPEFISALDALKPDLFVVVAYGSILKQKLLSVPRKGCLNIHYSLLPKYRGASPVESAILNDDRDTGVSILLLDEKMDHGPVVAARKIQDSRFKIEDSEWPLPAGELRRKCNKLGAELLTETIPLWLDGKLAEEPQDHSKATYTGKFVKADGEISLADDPYHNFLKIQAFESSIGTFFFTSPPVQGGDERGGRIRVLIKSAEFRDGNLAILQVIPEGKKEMDYEEFLRGLR